MKFAEGGYIFSSGIRLDTKPHFTQRIYACMTQEQAKILGFNIGVGIVKKEPKKTGLKRTVWLFEREILEKLEKTNLKDHHKVLKLNLFSMEYEIKPKFDNGRADAILMRDTANHWLKMWFIAFQTCIGEHLKTKV